MNKKLEEEVTIPRSKLRDERIKILYVDDEENNLLSLKAAFRREFKIFTASSTAEGKKILEQEEVQVIISDQRMPEQTGVEFFEEIRKTLPDPIRILLTGFTDIEAVIAAINRGEVYRYITKPWTEEDLRIVIKQASEIFILREENELLTKDLIDANKQLEFHVRQQLLS